jgi:sterol desaturase/sphingolipid hydroxylase (fatty acid hydroxylase superfamily)
MLVFAAFISLAIITLAVKESRRAALSRDASTWLLDTAGLLVQGILIPLLQTTLVYSLFSFLLPQAKGSLDLHPITAFLLNFVVVDYLYYWNHRLLHGKTFWQMHAVHHTAEHLDLFITSRNTLWTSLLIVYVWVNGFFIFLLREPQAYILAVSLTASLDLWRHTAFGLKQKSAFYRLLASLLITPHEHAWHHSNTKSGHNFGANLSLWDKVHRTYYSPAASPEQLGIPTSLTLPRKLLFPFP